MGRARVGGLTSVVGGIIRRRRESVDNYANVDQLVRQRKISESCSQKHRTEPSIIFIYEIDVIASKRENLQRGTDRRIVTQLMTCMDEANRLVKPVNGNEDSESSNSRPGHVLVIGATNRPDAIDPALRRPGRFDCEFGLGVPDEKARVEMLKVLTRNLKVEGALDLKKVARSTPGFVGADLAALVKKAGILAMKRILSHKNDVLSGEYREDLWRHLWPHEELDKLSITIADFEDAVEKVQPSSKREGFSVLPNVKWDEVGGLHSLKQVFDYHIAKRIKHPELFEHLGMNVESGILLYGPPGCGKTLIAKAVAGEAGANFIHIKKAVTMLQGRFSVQKIVNWEEVGGLQSLKEDLEKHIVDLIKALKDNRGILLYGPPGCGKTMIVKAVADKVGANFIPFQGLGMLYEVDKDLKSSLRTMFDEARACTPCILFFDHVDVFSLKCGEKGGYVMEQLLSQLLLELQKLEETQGVYVIGATNRPDLVDPALLTRKGFHKILHVPLPSPEERGLILTAIGRRKKIDVGVDLMALGQRCEGFSGADLVGLMDEAGMFAMEDKQESFADKTIKEEHFKKALEKSSPSVRKKSIELCESFRKERQFRE